MKLYPVWLSMLLAAVLLAACGAPGTALVIPSATAIPALPSDTATVPTVTSPAQPSATAPAPTPFDAPTQVPPAALAAQNALASRLGIAPEQIVITSIQQVEWPDACLGVRTPGEMCLQVVTSGYKILLQANGQSYEYHTNESGSSVRAVLTGSLGGQNPLQTQLVQVLTQALAAQLHIDPSQVSLVRIEPVKWPDSCLGLPRKDDMCNLAITDGFRVILSAGGKTYEYRTNKNYSIIRTPEGNTIEFSPSLILTPPAASTGGVLSFRTTGQACDLLHVDASGGVTYGPCVGALMPPTALQPARLEELKTLLTTYASFSVQTPTGYLTFSGQGSRQATKNEQRSIAAWAGLVLDEASAGRSGAGQGLALAWHREGGFAGFCDDLAVYTTGFASATSCKGGNPRDLGTVRLSAAEIDQLYQWLDGSQRFELEQKDAATADGMTIRVIFEGQGVQPLTAAGQAAVQQFASGVYAGIGK